MWRLSSINFVPCSIMSYWSVLIIDSRFIALPFRDGIHKTQWWQRVQMHQNISLLYNTPIHTTWTKSNSTNAHMHELTPTSTGTGCMTLQWHRKFQAVHITLEHQAHQRLTRLGTNSVYPEGLFSEGLQEDTRAWDRWAASSRAATVDVKTQCPQLTNVTRTRT